MLWKTDFNENHNQISNHWIHQILYLHKTIVYIMNQWCFPYTQKKKNFSTILLKLHILVAILIFIYDQMNVIWSSKFWCLFIIKTLRWEIHQNFDVFFFYRFEAKNASKPLPDLRSVYLADYRAGLTILAII